MNVLFKTLTTAAIALSLIACSASDEEATVAVVQTPPVEIVQPPVVTPSPVVPNPTSPVKPALPILNVACDENPLHGCPPNLPTPAPKPNPVKVVPPVDEWDCIVGCDTSTGM